MRNGRSADAGAVDSVRRKRELCQSVTLTAQKGTESEVVVKATQGGYVRQTASQAFNPDAQLHVTRNPGQLPRQVR